MSKPSSRKNESILKRSGFSLERLQALVLIDDAGSLIGAARGDEVRAGQFSRQIRDLERCFEVRLSRRDGRKVVLTADGAALARNAREFFQRMDDFLATRKGHSRSFTLGAGESLLQWIVVPALAALSRRAPTITFALRNLQNSDIVLGLEELALDFGLLRRESLRPPLESVSLGRLSYVLCVPRALQPTRGQTDAVAIMQQLPLAVHLETTYVEGELEAALRGRGIAPNILLRCDSFPNVMAALRTGAYATLMVRFPGAAPMPDGIDIIPLPFLDHTCRDIHLAWNPRLLEVRPDAESLKNELGRLMAWSDK